MTRQSHRSSSLGSMLPRPMICVRTQLEYQFAGTTNACFDSDAPRRLPILPDEYFDISAVDTGVWFTTVGTGGQIKATINASTMPAVYTGTFESLQSFWVPFNSGTPNQSLGVEVRSNKQLAFLHFLALQTRNCLFTTHCNNNNWHSRKLSTVTCSCQCRFSGSIGPLWPLQSFSDLVAVGVSGL